MIGVPACDAPWLPEMTVLNEVIGSSTASRPPARGIAGVLTEALKLPIPGMHAFTDANAEQEKE